MIANHTQNQRIVALLRVRGDEGITPLDALNIVGSLRLGARIFDIRNRANGYLRDDEQVDTDRVTTTTGNGTKTFARYVLRPRVTTSGTIDQRTLW